jgi:CRISPR/Cas system Type II protein with McrA/HNH and RuvC-like nuclease domain
MEPETSTTTAISDAVIGGTRTSRARKVARIALLKCFHYIKAHERHAFVSSAEDLVTEASRLPATPFLALCRVVQQE